MSGNRKALFIALICLGISIVLINAYVTARRYEMTSSFGDEVFVVVADKAIPEYSIIHPDQIKAVPVFKKFLQPQTIVVGSADIDKEPAAKEIIGKAAYVAIYPDEQVTMTKLIHQDGKPLLDRQVEKKMRAVTVQIAPHTGVGRLIRPGNRVDVMAAVNYDKGGENVFEVKTVAQNVLVLATGKHIQNSAPTGVDRQVLTLIEDEFEQRKRRDVGGSPESLSTSRPDDNYNNLTLQLSPEEAEKIMYVSTTYGDQRLYFTLRNGGEDASEKLETTVLDDVLGPDSNYGLSKIGRAHV